MFQDDPYTMLGVSREDALEHIKRTFHKLAHKHHPDKGGDEAVFKKISSAWAFLQQRHIQRPKGEPKQTQGNAKRGRFNPNTHEYDDLAFFEYEPETGRWYSNSDLDEDGFVVPTTVHKADLNEFRRKAAELRASRIGQKPEPFSSTEQFKRDHGMK